MMFFGSARKAFMEKLDLAAIEEAIRQAESKTSAELRVSVFPRVFGPLERAAKKVAGRLRMTETRERNGVLILVDPAHRRFIIWGDSAIHEKAGQGFWTRTAAAIAGRFRDGDFTGGLVHGIETAGRELTLHFPAGSAGHRDQLSNRVDV